MNLSLEPMDTSAVWGLSQRVDIRPLETTNQYYEFVEQTFVTANESVALDCHRTGTGKKGNKLEVKGGGATCSASHILSGEHVDFAFPD
jgi:hypothetical protein